MALNLPNKYRPRTLTEVVGQYLNVKSLVYATDTNQVPLCTMLRGPKGTGKTSLARIIAKCLNCESVKDSTSNPCLQCNPCRSIERGTCDGVIEIDAASNRGIDDIKKLKQSANYASFSVRNRVLIIDEFQNLSNDAFGALLKFLEEPPPCTYIVLCTTGSDRIPETILSRCVSFEFSKFSSEQILDRLKSVCKAEGIEYEDSALHLISKNAKGGMRDALSLLEKAVLAGSGKVAQEVALNITNSFDYRFIIHILYALLERDMGKILKITNGLDKASVNAANILDQVIESLYGVYAYNVTGDKNVLPSYQSEEQANELMTLSQYFDSSKLSGAIYTLSGSTKDLVYNQNPRIFVDVALQKAMTMYHT